MSSNMAKSDSSRIQSSQAQGGKNMSSGGFASRAQSAADRNAQGSSSNSNANARSGNGQQSKSGQK